MVEPEPEAAAKFAAAVPCCCYPRISMYSKSLLEREFTSLSAIKVVEEPDATGVEVMGSNLLVVV